MWLVFSIFALELLDLTASVQKAKSLPNVLCQTHETIIPVDPINHGYYPYYVKLHRCAGSANTISPKVQHCVAQRDKEIDVKVYSLSSFRRVTVTMKNHTSCAPECVANPSDCDLAVQDWDENVCACRCRYPDRPPKELACKEGFRWNNHKCACECNQAPKHCPIKMIWSKDICGCKCDSSVVNDCTQLKLGIDVDCQCVDVKASRRHREVFSRNRMFITLLIGQGVIIILLICALVHWVRKRNQNSSANTPIDGPDSQKTDDTVNSQVAVDSASTESLEISKESSDDDSYTTPLSSKVRVTNI